MKLIEKESLQGYRKKEKNEVDTKEKRQGEEEWKFKRGKEDTPSFAQLHKITYTCQLL